VFFGIPDDGKSPEKFCEFGSPTVVSFGFLDQSRYFLEIAPQLSSRGRVDPIPDPLLLTYSRCMKTTPLVESQCLHFLTEVLLEFISCR
jgi:hypothetical protein